jgi:hypothetical protein
MIKARGASPTASMPTHDHPHYPMKKLQFLSLLRLGSVLILGLMLSSCNDDPELVRKSEAQKAEICKLAGEVDIMDSPQNKLLNFS